MIVPSVLASGLLNEIVTFYGAPQTELPCMATGDPRPAIVWFKGGQLLPIAGNNT